MYQTNTKVEVRIFVKISFSESGSRCLGKTVYFRDGMILDFFNRYKWFFEYRAALLKVKNPKAFVLLEHGPYDYELPEDVYKEKIKSRYLSDKRQLTKFNNKLEDIKNRWNELFPIEDHPDWIKVMEKCKYYQKRYEQSKEEYESVFNNQ